MLKRVFLSSLLALLSGCADEKIIGEFEDAGTEGDGSNSDGVSEFDMLVAASESLSGSWNSPSLPLLPFFGVGPADMTMKLTPIKGTKRGTYRAVCPDRCRFGDARDGGMGAFEFDRGEYELLGFTTKGLVRGALSSDESTFGLTFDPTRPNQIFIVPLITAAAVPLDRDPGADPGP